MNIRQNTPLLAGIGVVVLAGLAWLAFGFFGIQAAFLDNEVDEAGPVFTATIEEQDEVAATDEFIEAMEEAQEDMTEIDEPIEAVEEEMADDDEATGDDGATNDTAADTANQPGGIVTIFSGAFSGESRYEIVGRADVLNDGSEQRFLRFEDFSSDNGPDLKVYLRAENGDFVSLGELKGNIGSQNYEIPVDVDLSVFSEVQIWCERFGVNFGSAFLSAT